MPHRSIHRIIFEQVLAVTSGYESADGTIRYREIPDAEDLFEIADRSLETRTRRAATLSVDELNLLQRDADALKLARAFIATRQGS